MPDAYYFTTTSNGGRVTITTTLYGPVDRARDERERLVAKHRGEQLDIDHAPHDECAERYQATQRAWHDDTLRQSRTSYGE